MDLNCAEGIMIQDVEYPLKEESLINHQPGGGQDMIRQGSGS